MKKAIVLLMRFNLAFTNRPDIQRLSKEWIDYRISIFMKYTCESLKNQSNQNFTAIINYDESSEVLIKDALSQYPKLPNNIIFNSSKGGISLDNLIRGYDYLYLTRLDCDDMYHPSFIQQLFDIEHDENLECIINQEGYIYDCLNDRLGIWYYVSPPFYTLIYKVDDFLKGLRHNIPNGHRDAINLNHYIIQKRNFMVIAHSKNTSTSFDKKFTKEVIEDEKLKDEIKKEFKVKR
jgi:hypothetical protein